MRLGQLSFLWSFFERGTLVVNQRLSDTQFAFLADFHRNINIRQCPLSTVYLIFLNYVSYSEPLKAGSRRHNGFFFAPISFLPPPSILPVDISHQLCLTLHVLCFMHITMFRSSRALCALLMRFLKYNSEPFGLEVLSKMNLRTGLQSITGNGIRYRILDSTWRKLVLRQLFIVK